MVSKYDTILYTFFMGIYDFLSNVQQKLGNIFPRVKRLGFTPALIGFTRYRWCGPGNEMNQPPATNLS